jgi:hypothetical protein
MRNITSKFKRVLEILPKNFLLPPQILKQAKHLFPKFLQTRQFSYSAAPNFSSLNSLGKENRLGTFKSPVCRELPDEFEIETLKNFNYRRSPC